MGVRETFTKEVISDLDIFLVRRVGKEFEAKEAAKTKAQRSGDDVFKYS